MPIIGPDNNIYLTFEVMWPELLFVSFSLNDFIELYEKRSNTHPWDPTIIAVRKLQGAVARCLQGRLTNISIMAKRLGELDHHYIDARIGIMDAARDLNVPESEIRFNEEYPEDFEW